VLHSSLSSDARYFCVLPSFARAETLRRPRPRRRARTRWPFQLLSLPAPCLTRLLAGSPGHLSCCKLPEKQMWSDIWCLPSCGATSVLHGSAAQARQYHSSRAMNKLVLDRVSRHNVMLLMQPAWIIEGTNMAPKQLHSLLTPRASARAQSAPGRASRCISMPLDNPMTSV